MPFVLSLIHISEPTRQAESSYAVFWCEDHGDLAFYHCDGKTPVGGWGIEAGDIVRFEVSRNRHLRQAKAPEVMRQRACHDLPDRLRSISGHGAAATGAPVGEAVVPIIPRQAARASL